MENNNSIPVLGIPVLNRGDLLLRCFNSIDYPVDELYIVFNHTGTPDASVQSAIEEMEHSVLQSQSQVKHVTVFRPEGELSNLGVSGSWNKIFETYPKAPYYFVVGNDIAFAEGDLKKMNEAALEKHLDSTLLFANHGFSFFVITQLALTHIGVFDSESFPVAYKEDQDYFYRLTLSKLKSTNVQGTNAIHGDIGPGGSRGSSTIYSSKEYMAKNAHTQMQNVRQYIMKWGGDAGHEIYKHPYNDPTKDIKYIRKNPEKWIW